MKTHICTTKVYIYKAGMLLAYVVVYWLIDLKENNMNKAYIYEIENQPALEASTLELVDILIYRLEITNGLEFVSPDKRKQLCEALLQPCCYVLEGV